MKNLIQVIKKEKIVVAKTTKQHKAFTTKLNNLEVILENLYECTRKIENLKETIRVVCQIIKTTFKDYLDLAN
jgi:hypothetical protein